MGGVGPGPREPVAGPGAWEWQGQGLDTAADGGIAPNGAHRTRDGVGSLGRVRSAHHRRRREISAAGTRLKWGG